MPWVLFTLNFYCAKLVKRYHHIKVFFYIIVNYFGGAHSELFIQYIQILPIFVHYGDWPHAP